jgi:branched-chain amino acid transport system substrate-binding protein
MARVRSAFFGSSWLATAVMVVCGCSDSQRPLIDIGAIITTSGAKANAYDLEAIKRAIVDINEAGGVLGSNLSLLEQEDYGDASAASRAAAKLSQSVPVIIGPLENDAALTLLATTVPAGVVLISGSVTDPAMSTAPSHGLFFRTCASDIFEGRLLAQRARAAGKSRAAVFLDWTSSGIAVSKAFESQFVALGGVITHEEHVYSAASTTSVEATKVLTVAMGTNPDVIFLATDIDPGGLLFRQYGANFASSPVLVQMTSKMANVRLLNLIGGIDPAFPHEGTTLPVRSDEPYASFAAAYIRDTGRDPALGQTTSFYYDAVFLIALAMEAGGEATGAAISQQLASIIGDAGTQYDHRSFSAAKDAVRVGTPIQWLGISGALNLASNGEPASADYCIWQIQGGQIVCTEPVVHVD